MIWIDWTDGRRREKTGGIRIPKDGMRMPPKA